MTGHGAYVPVDVLEHGFCRRCFDRARAEAKTQEEGLCSFFYRGSRASVAGRVEPLVMWQLRCDNSAFTIGYATSSVVFKKRKI